LLRQAAVGQRHHDGLDGLAPAFVGNADDRHVRHLRVASQHALELGGVDVLAAGDDHVLDPVADVEEAVRVDVAGVTGVEPAIPHHDRGVLGPPPVAGHEAASPVDDLTDLAAWYGVPEWVDDLHLGPEHGPPAG